MKMKDVDHNGTKRDYMRTQSRYESVLCDLDFCNSLIKFARGITGRVGAQNYTPHLIFSSGDRNDRIRPASEAGKARMIYTPRTDNLRSHLTLLLQQ